jgi:hypothetical protein|tara:strand:- start:200 stop:397 length:198 start_codon:yes stop_codon:yes gene_type:complete
MGGYFQWVSDSLNFSYLLSGHACIFLYQFFFMIGKGVKCARMIGPMAAAEFEATSTFQCDERQFF